MTHLVYLNAGVFFLAMILPALLCGCSPHGGLGLEPVKEPAPQEQLVSAFGCSETIALAANAGIDYADTVYGSLEKDTHSLHHIFWLCGYGGFDCEPAEAHAAVLVELLRRLGDEFFSRCLAAERPAIRREVRGYLRMGFAGRGIDARAFRKTIDAMSGS